MEPNKDTSRDNKEKREIKIIKNRQNLNVIMSSEDKRARDEI